MLKIFIDRPIFSAVISILIVFLGIIGLTSLPIERFPDIATPTVSVTATYTGANAETVQKSVLVPLEEAINGVENMLYMTSEATNNGGATIRVYFKQGTDPDMATVNVQNRVSQATAQLPSDVTRGGVSVSKQQSSTIMIFGLYSSDDRFDSDFVSNYARINLLPQVLRINGVGGINALGSEYAMRIWLKPDVMTQYGLIPSDVTAAVDGQSFESPTGRLGGDSDHTFQYTLRYQGRFEKPEQYENIIIRSLPGGEVLRLKDVAEVELGALSYALMPQIKGHPGTVCLVQQSPGSNATEISKAVNQLLEDVAQDLPPGVKVSKMLDVNEFLDASIKNVLITLLEAILLVIIVVYVFLQSLRATLIPLVGIGVSIVGTFGILALCGFSINLLTLFALVLAIGSVVDDAIIVVEAIQAKLDEGYRSSYKAAVDGMKTITTAVITTTLVFMSVFIPVSFMGGTSGVFFTQFGITMAAAIGLSTLNALTLSPALCALLLKPTDESGKKTFEQRFRVAFNASFSTLTARYKGGVSFLIRYKWITATLLIGSIIALGTLIGTTKTGFVPQEDQGLLYVNIMAAPGNTLLQTSTIMDRVEQAIKDIPQIETYSKNTGFSMLTGQNATSGTFIVRLRPWEERKGKENSIDAVTQEITRRTAHIKEARIFLFAMPMIIGYSSASGVELHLQDKTGGSISDFFTVAQGYIAELNQRPEVAMAYSGFNTNYPQYMVDVDVARCEQVGLSPQEVMTVLSGYYGGQYITDLNRFSRVYRVMIQAAPEDRLDEQSLDQVYVRTGEGGMAPISQFITLTRMYGPESLNRFNLFNSISVNVNIADGYSSGDAIRAVRETAAASLPIGYGYEFGGMTREESNSSNDIFLIFAICIVFIYLVLCALYESFLIPFAVILSVPVGLMGSFLFTRIMGLENNIYLQMGVIMLIGLLAKTAILITEYGQQARKRGLSIREAALTAATIRLRPILMTALTMIVGLTPLLFSTGVGANGNVSLGVGAVGGLFIGTLALLFITPVLFIWMQQLQEKLSPGKRTEREEENS